MIRLVCMFQKNLSAMHTAVEKDLKNLKFWLWENKMSLNAEKTKHLLFHLRIVGDKS